MYYHMHMALERSTRHSRYNLNYHLVAVPKYRRRILKDAVRERLMAVVNEVCAEREWEVLGLEIMSDHMHLFVSCPPKWAPADIAKIIKGVTARRVLQTFPHLSAKGHLWTSAYYIGSAGNVSAEVIQQYIAAQKEAD